MDESTPGREYKGREYPTGSSPVSQGGTHLSPSPPEETTAKAMESEEHGRIIVRPVTEGWDIVDERDTILRHGLPDENRAISEAEEIARRDDAEVEVVALDGSTKEIRHFAGEGRTKGLD